MRKTLAVLLAVCAARAAWAMHADERAGTPEAPAGTSYFGLRYYRPETGRWVKRDPIGERGSANLFAFCKGDPMAHVDPHGRNPVGGVIVGGVAWGAAEAAAAAFGLSVTACLVTPECAEAMHEAIEEAMSELADTTIELHKYKCKQLHSEYKSLESLCSKCAELGRGRTCVERVKRCAHGTVNSACWAGVVTKRKTFMLIGCDFVLEEPNWSGHGNELMSKMRAAGKCAVQALSNCAKMVLP